MYVSLYHSSCCGCKWLLSMAPANGYISIDFKIMNANNGKWRKQFVFLFCCSICVVFAFAEPLLNAADCCHPLGPAANVGSHTTHSHTATQPHSHTSIQTDERLDGRLDGEKVTSISGGITILGLYVASGLDPPRAAQRQAKEACLWVWLPYLHIGVDVCCLDCFN